MVTEMKWKKNPNGRRRRPIFLKSKAERHRPTIPSDAIVRIQTDHFSLVHFPAELLLLSLLLLRRGL